IEVLAVADLRKEGFDEDAVKRLKLLGVPFLPGYVVTKARQFRTLRGAVFCSVDDGNKKTLECDLLVASAGEIPLSQLLSVAGTRMAYDPLTASFLPREVPPGVHGAGKVLGCDNAEAIEAQGREAGLVALQDVGLDVTPALRAAREAVASLPGPKAGWDGVEAPSRGYRRFVGFDEDVTVKQVEQAMGDGFDQPELLKRYTATGTGQSQGYLTGHNLALLMAAKKALRPGSFMPTTVRPPLAPTTLGVLAGRRRHPVKRTPVHSAQRALGGNFRLAGEWERARHFTDEKAWDEILNVRKNVGFIDVSTLGKFRVRGPDALKLLQRVYINDIGKVSEGRLTYSVMCNEEGVVIDDGVMTKWADNDYFFTTSTLRAAYTAEWLGFHSREEDWEAYVINLTDALAAINLAGPRSRDVLKRLTDADVSNEAFPFMGFRRVTLCGDIEALIARIGFVGEVCYEIHVPASYGPALHEAIIEAGKEWGIQPFGLEAQSVLRLEKGHVIIVVDTDNHTTLHEIGLNKIWAQHKTDAKTVGVPAVRFAEGQTHRERLVGFMMEERSQTPADGSIVVADGVVKGRVCTSRYSPTLEQSIGMALIEPDLAVMGGCLDVYMDGKLVKGRLPPVQTRRAKIVPMPFYDPKGERMRR
ncbi:MAG: glycine cleavage T protein (aminomethyl transferase), partial [Desulfobacterales bacterium]|nr:glycine cleavage T protein (aminomethyl transferase) [Desulfobacterales bacterium]